jgi:3'-phosphoadenosine 5'-phosphosulfate (PAPS) 3'-phosphatase|tara:strand:+ start:468 stop:716 length:249 start_codon:yes stop_codon:yes gene_type:complete
MKKTLFKVLCGVLVLVSTSCTQTTTEELSDVYMTINTRPVGSSQVKYVSDSIRLTQQQVDYILNDSLEGYVFMEFNHPNKEQ